MKRCKWPVTKLEIDYHDHEWCKPSFDNRFLFEMLVLEMMQAGLSWALILERRENYRAAFFNFEVDRIVMMNESDIDVLTLDEGLIRHRLKLQSIVTNAKIVKNMDESLSDFMWQFTDHKQIVNDIDSHENTQSMNDLSIRISKDMKKMGFKFVGPTIIYSYMQAIGMVNDHENTCDYKYSDIKY